MRLPTVRRLLLARIPPRCPAPSKNHIALILDAILLASIIICALVSITILVSVFVAGISILVLVLLVLEYCDSPRLR